MGYDTNTIGKARTSYDVVTTEPTLAQKKKVMKNLQKFLARQFGKLMCVLGVALAFAATTTVCKADDISDATTAVSGYVTAAIAVGIAVLLFVLGRKVIRKLIVGMGIASLATMAFNASAVAPTDITGVTTAVSGYVTAAIAVGVAVLLFVLGRKVIRKLI